MYMGLTMVGRQQYLRLSHQYLSLVEGEDLLEKFINNQIIITLCKIDLNRK
jgi:hypothetical protein